jgi:phosphoribosylformylglycinamidine synthase
VEAGAPPPLDLAFEKSLLGLLQRIAREDLARSVHDCAEGGLLVAVAECCLGARGDIGAAISLQSRGMRLDGLLFGEDASRVLLSVPPDKMDSLTAAAHEAGIPATSIGTVGGDRLTLSVEGQPMMDLAVARIRSVWEKGMARIVG